ncbi:flagellar motor switch protein FliM [Neobacillus novalis]|uniref:Flagellar motor switch protein FliM n=1 Tax=Neobacillus novalis TaxID=220687 RepID=A0AA95MQF0_9BACI|nr:flagellar motor switch protein FliM [Neobacillus novalis]WHY88399.1 flagellar motor switch protein FliM [Neobacillus novalis]
MADRNSISHQELTEANRTANVKVYDFKRAQKRLSTEQLRVLKKIHESFAYRLSSTFSTQLRTITQVDVVSAEQLTYEDFIQTLPGNTVLAVLEAAGQEKRLALNFPPRMAFAMIDLLLGGKGTWENTETTSITPIESNVLKRVVEGVIQNLHKAWTDMITLKLKSASVETNPQFLQLVDPADPVVVMTFTVSFGEMLERMQLCMPYTLIEPFISNLSAHNLLVHSQEVKNNLENDFIQERIEHLTVPVRVELGRAAISIEEFLGLSVNDVIQLDQLVDEPLSVKINDETKFLAFPGTKKSRMAIKIEQVVEGEEKNER